MRYFSRVDYDARNSHQFVQHVGLQLSEFDGVLVGKQKHLKTSVIRLVLLENVSVFHLHTFLEQRVELPRRVSQKPSQILVQTIHSIQLHLQNVFAQLNVVDQLLLIPFVDQNIKSLHCLTVHTIHS